MSINLDKSSIEKKYFYSENGNTFGPFPLSALLTKIQAETLVYREGIEWTKAGELYELKRFFKKGNAGKNVIQQTQNTTTPAIVNKEKGKFSVLWIVLVLVLSTGAGYYYFTQLQIPVISNEPIIEIDTTPVVSDILSDFDVFDIEVVRKYEPTEEQKVIAESLFNAANTAMVNNDIIGAIIKYKESLKNAPHSNTYFRLSDAYLVSKDYERSEMCLQLANDMDYQPKSELDHKLIALHVILGKFDLVTEEINITITGDKNYMATIENDSLFYLYRQSEHYIALIEKDVEFDREPDYLHLIKGYYEALNSRTLNAADYFGEQVRQFINIKNTTPVEINELLSASNDYTEGKSVLIDNKLIQPNMNTRQVWILYKCFRNSTNKFQTCRVKAEFIFDDQKKILSYKELEVKDLRFSETQ